MVGPKGAAVGELTERQRAVLELVQRRFRRDGRAPSYREIASRLGVDVRAAFQHVEALERKGVLERRGGRVELLGDYRPERGIPVLGRVAAGAPILATENIVGHVDLARELRGAEMDELFLLEVRGESMTGAGIHDGDLVLVRSQRTVADGEIAAVVIGEEATVKRVRFRGGRLRLEPANPRHRPITVGPEDEVRIAGKVLMAVRKV
jgi:repressor LexA